jgi:putative ABC transport system permease protein
VLGLALAVWGVEAATKAVAEALPRAQEIRVGWHVFAFTSGISLLTGLAFGLAPARAPQRIRVNDVLREGGRGSTSGAFTSRLRGALVAAEVALTLVLLVGAGLLGRSFHNVLGNDPGFDPERVVVLRVSAPESRYASPAALLSFFRALVERTDNLPGVSASAIAVSLPIDETSEAPFEIEGRERAPSEPPAWAEYNVGSAGFFRTLAIPVRKGRSFSETDGAEAPAVAVVSESAARRFWPGEDPLGKRLRIGKIGAGDTFPWMESSASWATSAATASTRTRSPPSTCPTPRFRDPGSASSAT